MEGRDRKTVTSSRPARAGYIVKPIHSGVVHSKGRGQLSFCARLVLDMYVSVELLDAVSQAAQKYEALYMGILPVNKAMGKD